MSYRLKKDEPLAPGIRRIAREQLEQAPGEIKGLSNQDEGVANIFQWPAFEPVGDLLQNRRSLTSLRAEAFREIRDFGLERCGRFGKRILFRACSVAQLREHLQLGCVGADPVAENFNSWRKRVKDLSYQLLVLSDLNRTVVCEIAEAARTLSRQLGDLP